MAVYCGSKEEGKQRQETGERGRVGENGSRCLASVQSHAIPEGKKSGGRSQNCIRQSLEVPVYPLRWVRAGASE